MLRSALPVLFSHTSHFKKTRGVKKNPENPSLLLPGGGASASVERVNNLFLPAAPRVARGNPPSTPWCVFVSVKGRCRVVRASRRGSSGPRNRGRRAPPDCCWRARSPTTTSMCRAAAAVWPPCAAASRCKTPPAGRTMSSWRAGQRASPVSSQPKVLILTDILAIAPGKSALICVCSYIIFAFFNYFFLLWIFCLQSCKKIAKFCSNFERCGDRRDRDGTLTPAWAQIGNLHIADVAQVAFVRCMSLPVDKLG